MIRNRRTCGRHGLAVLLLLVPLGLGADEPPQLKKKPRPAEPTTEPAPKPSEKPQPRDPSQSTEEPAKLLERIVRNLEAASKRLSDQDAGSKTREHQAEALRAIDELLKPPPNDPKQSASSPPPMGPANAPPSGNDSSSSSSQRSSSGGTQSKGLSRREKRLQQSANGSTTSRPMTHPGSTHNSQPTPQPKEEKPGKADPKTGSSGGELNRIADVYKDVWGHLPETMRREMDQYYREQFMPRYSDLLRQYYSTIAEKNRRGGR